MKIPEQLQRLDQRSDCEAEVAWEQEVRRRSASVANGSAKLIEGKTVLKDIADRIAAIRNQVRKPRP